MEIRTEEMREIDILAQRIALPFIEKIREIERKADVLLSELASAKTQLAEEKASRAKDVEYYIGRASLLQEEKEILQEQVSELVPRPIEHQHDPDDPQPVVALDFDGTIKPQISKGDGGNYPLTDKYSDPFPEVKGWFDRWKSRGTCIHLVTAGLYYDGKGGLEVYEARLALLKGWASRYGIPIDLILPKIPSDAYVDDRMVEVPGDPSMKEGLASPPDWNIVGETIEKDLNKKFAVNEFGIWERKDRKRIGREITDWPDPNMFKDHPRGYSGGRVDVDMHRTLSQSSSSLRVAPPMENAVESMRELYRKGVTITVSCAGWNPRTHSIADSARRLAAIRQWLHQWSVPYDRVAAKDHADSFVDDKGVRWISWQDAMPKIYKKLPSTIGYVES